MKKRFFALYFVGFALIFSSIPAMAITVDDVFPDYLGDPQFIDVPLDTWYTEEVRLCYGIGMMNGIGGNRFAPENQMTRGEVIALAVRIHHAVYANQETPSLAPVEGDWYQVYVNYLRQIGITDVVNPRGKATRFYFARLIAQVLPEEALAPINQITSIPDIENDDVLRLYNAGVLTGINGSTLAFNPGGTIMRAEAATMVARVARSVLRRQIVPSST